MNDPDDGATIDALMDDLHKVLSPELNYNVAKNNKSLNSKVLKYMNIVFYSIIGIAMFLCFFSLCSSMASNLFE